MIFLESKLIDSTLMEEFSDEIFVDIDNVARWVHKQKDEDAYEKWYETIVPPIDNSVFTYKFFAGNYGAVVVSKMDLFSTDEKERKKLKDFLGGYNGDAQNIQGLKLFATDPHAEARWLVAFTMFVSDRYDLSDAAFVGQVTNLVSPEGGRVGSGSGVYTAAELIHSQSQYSEKEIGEHVIAEIQPVIVAISLMHCKNIELVNRPITRPEKRRAKRTGVPVTQFKVLNIEPFKKKVINEAAGSGQSGLKLAMHICRGHFREYSEDRPLFGKYAGRFWIPQHAKGSKSEGVVEKDYKVDV